MHLGDQLYFWSPLKLLQSQGIDCQIIGPSALDFFFKASGIPIALIEELPELTGEIVLAKDEMAHHLSQTLKGSYHSLGLNFRTLPGKASISELIYLQICHYINTQTEVKINPQPKLLQTQEAPNFQAHSLPIPLPTDKNSALYNDYVASHFYQAYKRLTLLHTLGKKESKKNTALLYIGSQKDNKERPECPEFITMDLRGQLSLEDTVVLLSHPKIKKLISYDTFLCHIASLYNLEIEIVARNKTEKSFIEERFIPITPKPHLKKVVY